MSICTGTPAVYDGKVFIPISSIEAAAAADSNYNCCTTSGGVAVLDVKNGEKVWYHRVIAATATAQSKKKNSKPFFGPSGAPVWCSPTIDRKRGLVYIGTGENYSEPATATSDALQAINLATGKLVWNFQGVSHDAWNVGCPVVVNCPGNKGRDLDFGMAPILVTGPDGKDRLIAGEKSGVVYALKPETGKLLWKTRIGKGGMLGGIHWGLAADQAHVYVANADNALALSRSNSQVKANPGIVAINIISGKITWIALAPAVSGKESYLGANSAAPTVLPDLVLAGTLDGHIRAYAKENGQIVWDYNTRRSYESADGLKGNGGSIDSSAPVVSGGMMFINSGYAQFGEKPGNVLLAFATGK